MYNIKAVLSYFEDVLKNLPANAGDIGDVDSVPGSRRSPGGRNGNPLQYSCLGNPMVRGAWRAAVHRIAKSQSARARAHTHTHTRTCTHMHARKQFRSHPLPSLYLSPTTKLIKYASEYEKIRKIFDRQAFSPILSLA